MFLIVCLVATFGGLSPASAANQSMCCDQTRTINTGLDTGTGKVLWMQSDGNLVHYVNSSPVWATYSTTGSYMKAQSDGNVVLYTSGGQWLWQTATDLYPSSTLILQDDGNLVVYSSGGTAVWAKSWAKSASGAKTYSQRQFPRYGWSVGSQFSCLDSLWIGESNWVWNATNPSSGAYGIPQALPASKLATAGTNWQHDGQTQVQWGLKYIDTVYSTPCSAYSLWLSRNPHWY